MEVVTLLISMFVLVVAVAALALTGGIQEITPSHRRRVGPSRRSSRSS